MIKGFFVFCLCEYLQCIIFNHYQILRKMKNLKAIILTALIAICCFAFVNAQENAKLFSITAEVQPQKAILSIGGGTSLPSSDAKDQAYLSNSAGINADLFLSLIRKGWDGVVKGTGGPKLTAGLNFGGAYNFGGSGGFGTTPNPFAVTGQTSSVVSDRGGAPADPGFRMGAGPQVNFHFGKLIVSPMVLGEYFSMTQKEMSIVQTTQYNGQSYDFNLATLPETKTSGFAVTPKLRMQYLITSRIGFFGDAAYTKGPKTKTVVSKLVPNGSPTTPGNTYELQALTTGTMVKGEPQKTALNATGFNFGVVIGFGGNGHGDDLTNGVVKPACTCCGSRTHDRLSCPDITRCNTQTASSQVALSDDLHKATGDIKKGWDGTVKGLFVGNYAEIAVSKNGGIEKLIEQINKAGKGKATFEKYGDDKFIKIVRKEKNTYISEFYPYDGSGSGPMGIINGGYTISCQGSCAEGCNLNLEKTACSPCGDMYLCTLVRHSGSPWFHDYFDRGSLVNFPIETGTGGTLTATSLNHIKDLILAQMPHATNMISEIKKEENLLYIETRFEDKGKDFVLVSKLDTGGKKWVIDRSTLMACVGSCNGKTYDCSLNGWGSVGSHKYCNCDTGCRFKIIAFPELGGGMSSGLNLEDMIISDKN